MLELRRARYCCGILSVCPSVTLVDCDHTGGNSSKIISRLDSLGCTLSAYPNITDLLLGEHLEILARIREGHRQKWISAFKSFNISKTRQDKTKVTIEDQ